MPIYEYECENKHRFEKWQSMKDEAVKECPECGTLVRRILHPAGIIFKGSGWYITDSRKSSGGDSDGGSKTKTESKGGGDSKSETKSESKTEGSGSKSEAKAESSGSAKSDSKSSSSTE